ncbi:MAG TPA: hypothetical protein PL182_13615 [Pseudobdellovibrionaceae bacterium]|nr:hypothetical protein [Pseudobdellovibrionaceae bacterium]
MKALLISISSVIFMASVGAAAEAPPVVSLRCETPWPTASAFAETKDGRVQMTLVFHYGSGRIPLKADSLAPDDYVAMESSIRLLRQLDRRLVLEWDQTNCVSGTEGLFRCLQGTHVMPENSTGLKLDSVSFFTTRMTEQHIAMTRERYNVELWMAVKDTVLRVSLPYDLKDCSFKPQSSREDGFNHLLVRSSK